MTYKEAKEFTADEFDLQVVISMQTCRTKKDVMDLLKDVRQHERMLMIEPRNPHPHPNRPIPGDPFAEEENDEN
jgi:hypothetical protein